MNTVNPESVAPVNKISECLKKQQKKQRDKPLKEFLVCCTQTLKGNLCAWKRRGGCMTKRRPGVRTCWGERYLGTDRIGQSETCKHSNQVTTLSWSQLQQHLQYKEQLCYFITIKLLFIFHFSMHLGFSCSCAINPPSYNTTTDNSLCILLIGSLLLLWYNSRIVTAACVFLLCAADPLQRYFKFKNAL